MISAGGKGCRCAGLTALSPLWADCLAIWYPQPHGILAACPGLYKRCFTFLLNDVIETVPHFLHLRAVWMTTAVWSLCKAHKNRLSRMQVKGWAVWLCWETAVCVHCGHWLAASAFLGAKRSRLNTCSHIAAQCSVSRTGTATSSSSSNRYCLFCLVLSTVDWTRRSPILDRSGDTTCAPTRSEWIRYLGPFSRNKAVRVAFFYKNKQQGFMVFPRV
jgi:hypothetical protein